MLVNSNLDACLYFIIVPPIFYMEWKRIENDFNVPLWDILNTCIELL